MVLFKITSETSAETDVNCLDSQTLFCISQILGVCLSAHVIFAMSVWHNMIIRSHLHYICTRVSADVSH